MPLTHSRRLLLGASVAVALLLVGAALVFRHLSGGAEAGQLVRDDLTIPGRSVTLRVPGGQLALRVGEPTTSLPDHLRVGNGRDQQTKRVKDFGRFVGVSWQLLPRPQPEMPTLTQRAVQVAVLSGGRTWQLGGDDKAPVLAAHGVWVALPGKAEDLRVAVTYDGLTQTVDPRSGKIISGAAKPLYAETSPVWQGLDCRGLKLEAPGFGFEDRGHELVECRAWPAYSSPYAEGVGWAKPGKAFLTVTLTTSWPHTFLRWPAGRISSGQALYTPQLTRTTVTLDGQPPVARADYYQQSEAEIARKNLSGSRYTFAVDAAADQHRLAFHQDYEDEKPTVGAETPGAPRRLHATTDFTATLTR